MKRFLSMLLVVALVALCAGAYAENGSWTCDACGALNTTKYCTVCGAKRPGGLACPGCGTEYPGDTDAVFCGECGTKLRQEAEAGEEVASSRYEGSGFDTPEEAALWYLAGIRNLDFEQILSAFAWETQAAHFDFRAFISRIQNIVISYHPGMPASNGLLLSAMVEELRDYQVDLIRRALENFVNDEVPNNGAVSVGLQTEEEMEAYLERCDNGKVEALATMGNIVFIRRMT